MERQYTEQEVTQVIKKAAELQERLAPATVRTDGIGKAELVRIATELGLNEDFVHKALEDRTTFAVSDEGNITSMSRTLERTAAGLPNSEAFEIVLDEFGPSMGVQSGPNTVGDTMTYQSMIGMTHCDMLVSKKQGRTRIKVGTTTFLPTISIAAPAAIALLTFVVAFANAGTVAGVPGNIAAWIAGIGGAIGTWAVTRWINKWSNKRVVERLEATVDRLNAEADRGS